MNTVVGIEVPIELVEKYLSSLVNQFFKILPLKEDEEPSLGEFMRSFQRELLGCKGLIEQLSYDSMFLSLIAILQYLIDEECDVPTVKHEVFKAIKICNNLREKYCGKEG